MGKERTIPGDWRGCRGWDGVGVGGESVERVEGRHGDR